MPRTPMARMTAAAIFNLVTNMACKTPSVNVATCVEITPAAREFPAATRSAA